MGPVLSGQRTPHMWGPPSFGGGAKARTGGRHGPQAPHLFGNAAAESGRLSSEAARVEGRYAREEAVLGGKRVVQHFSDKTYIKKF